MRGGKDLPRVAEEQLRELVLLVVQPHGVGRRFQHVLVTVQRGVSHGQQRGGIDAAAPHQRPDTGQKFAGGKGLGEIIVCPGVQPGHPVGHLRLGREEEGGRGDPLCAGRFQDLDAVFPRHHDVQHQRVVAGGPEIVQGVVAVVDQVHGVFIFFQHDLQRSCNGHFILCDQDPHGYPLPSFLLFYEAKPK